MENELENDMEAGIMWLPSSISSGHDSSHHGCPTSTSIPNTGNFPSQPEIFGIKFWIEC